MIYNDSNINSINDSADYWYYKIGVNVIPADTKNKQTNENWSQWQDKPIPDELHQQRKKNGEYNKGIALIPGKIWKGQFKGRYLVAIDLDNKKAIEEFCRDSLEELKQKTLVEQHADPDKMHIYFIVEREISNKSTDKTNVDILAKINSDEIPALEVKSNGKGIMFCADSPHNNGSNYHIIGTLKPEVFQASDVEQRISLICQKHNIPYGINNDSLSLSNKIPIEELFKPETKILEGHNRHEALLRIMESLLQRNRGILSLAKIKQLAYELNPKHCLPPLENKEFEKQWECAVNFISRKNITENDSQENNNIDSDYKENHTKSSTKILDNLTKHKIDLFKDQYGNAHARITVNDHKEILSVESSRFERYLSKLYYDNNNNNEKNIINKEALSNVIRKLQAEAEFEGKTIPLHLRVAWSDKKDAIYYDLTDEKWRCIEITKDKGWKSIDSNTNNNIFFTRYNQKPQIEPIRDYDSKILDKFIDSANIKNKKHKLLLNVYIISLLIPGISHPILLPHGEQGSAKSTLQNKIKLLIDPAEPELLSIHNDKTEFIQQLSHNYLAFYDNIRHEPPWLSDETCKAVTGIGFTKRKHYTNDEDFVYKFKRCLSFSGINVIFTEPDARDRSITIELEGILDKVTEEKIYSDFYQQLPQLLGYMFDIVSKALQIKDSVKIDRLPRMADFASWGEAISRAMGYTPLEFLNSYYENLEEQNIEIIESDQFTDTIGKLLDFNITSWISSPKDLIKKLKEYGDAKEIDTTKFPKQPNSLVRRLKKVKPNLREGLGIEVIIARITSGKGNKTKINSAIIKIRKISPISPISPVSKNDEENKGKNIGDIEKTGDNTSNEIIIRPANDDQTCAHFSSDIVKNGGNGDTGDKLNIPHIEIAANSNFNFNYLGNNLYNKIEQYLSMGKSLKCHHKNCNNKEYLSLNDYNIHCHSSHPKQPMYPELSLIKMMGIEPKGNPWE